MFIEQLSLAHVQAIGAQAGVSMSYFNLDYGIDGTFRSIIRTSVCTSGAAIDSQIEASINIWRLSADHSLSILSRSFAAPSSLNIL
jgi:hypothetical protein